MRRAVEIFAIICMLAGVAVMSAPFWHNYFFNIKIDRELQTYEKSWTQEDMEAELARARAYNMELLKKPAYFYDVTKEKGEDLEEYMSLLNITGTGLMGYIEIPDIKLKLPIYHGTADDVLLRGAGHQAGSSLPVGGLGTHTVIYGHSGQASAKLFTDLDQVQSGAKFYIHMFDQILVYQIDTIQIVLPEVLEDAAFLGIKEHEDRATLVTCTPYGVNSHRLLVQGKRYMEESGT